MDDIKLQIERMDETISRYKELLQKEEIDTVTGLYSKNKFFSKTEEMLAHNPDKKFVFVRVNIDKFQLVNSFFGFDEGNRLLEYFAYQLKKISLLAPLSVLGYFGADDFVVCCQDFPNNLSVAIVQRSIRSVVTGYRDDYRLSVSVGIYHIENNSMPLELINSKAIVAIKKSKSQYGESYSVYSEHMDSDSVHRQKVLNEIQIAFAERQFEIFLQPKCDLLTGKVIGAESLVRWMHPERGIISPGEFIPILESTGLIAKLDEYVWGETCKHIYSWIEKGITPIPISVNVSRVDLHNADLPNILGGLVGKYHIPIEYVHLEITESAYSENSNEILGMVNRLHDMGFHIELDDFGTGYSSLSILNAMSLNTLKLDMSFIHEQGSNGNNGQIVNFIVKLAKQLHLSVIAEGVETADQINFLRGIGCEYGQGYFFSKPLCKADFDDYMISQREGMNGFFELDQQILLDVDDIWIPNSNFNFVFNNFIGALILYEIRDSYLSLLRVNDEFLRLSKASGNSFEYFEEDILKNIHPDDLQTMKNTITQFENAGVSQRIEVRFKNIDSADEYTWMRLHGKTVVREKKSSFVLVSVENINEEKKSFEKMRAAALIRKDIEQQLAVYKTIGGDGVFCCVLKNTLVLMYANDPCYEIFEVTKDYALEHASDIFEELIDCEDYKRISEYIKNAVDNKITDFELNFKINTKKGNKTFVFVKGCIRYNEEYPIMEAIIRDMNNVGKLFIKNV